MIELDEGFLDVVWHGEVDLSLGIVPVELDSDVAFTFPVFRYGVVLFQNVHKMSGICAAFVLDAKIVDDESELNWSRLVHPEAWYELALVVPMLLCRHH